MANCEQLRFQHTDLAGSEANPKTVAAAEEILQQAESADGFAALSEQFVAGLTDPRVGHQHVLVFNGDELVGLAGLEESAGEISAELVIAPGHRRQGYGNCLYEHLAEAVDKQGKKLQAWAHGQLPAAQAIAEKRGLAIVRHLLVMSVTGQALEKAGQPGEGPDGYVAKNYRESVEAFGTEHVEESWIAANNQAFSWHPEQGGWDRDRLHRSMEAEWFDPQDVIFLWDVGAAGSSAGAGEAAGSSAGAGSSTGEAGASSSAGETDAPGAAVDKQPVLAGFHWTKWHGAAAETDTATGEVYVIALASAYQGRGLSGHLLRLGIKQMVNKGATEVILYVEKDNESAVRVYEKSGFDVAENHVVYAASSKNDADAA